MQRKSHKSELLFYYKNHNKLCCCICISKIKGNNYGQHTDCDVCLVEKIADEKLKNLKSNMQYLEDISLKLDNSMEELKKIITKIEENKEELRIKVAKIFTKLRNALNDKEDQLLLEIDSKFNEFIFDQKLLKQSEKMPNKIKEYLEKGKRMENELKNENKKLCVFINDCIEIENSIQNIKLIQQNIDKYNSEPINIYFSPNNEEEINKIINNIKNFGEIIKEGNDKYFITNLNSLIINDIKKYNKILKTRINPNKKVSAELLYRLTRDGENVSTFHKLCDNKGPTLTLFNVADANIGGIYTPLSWDTNSSTKNDKETFMFNLNKEEKYNKVTDNISIWCTEYFGPWTLYFGFNKTMKKIEHRGADIDPHYANENSAK